MTPSFKLFYLVALYYIMNWASDKNNYIVAVMVARVVTVVRGVAIKVAVAKNGNMTSCFN
jgi:hypothetical protein